MRYYSSHSHLRLYRVRVHLHVQLWMQTLAQHHDHGRHDLAEMLQPSIAGDTRNQVRPVRGAVHGATGESMWGHPLKTPHLRLNRVRLHLHLQLWMQALGPHQDGRRRPAVILQPRPGRPRG